MTTVLNIITHGIIILGIGLMLGFIVAMIVKGSPKLEKFIRGMALMVGFLIYFVIRGIGVSIPDWIVNALQQGKLLFAIAGILFPLTFGIGITWYCLDAWGRKNNLSSRGHATGVVTANPVCRRRA